MRKLLILDYTLWKKDEEYNKDYDWSNTHERNTDQKSKKAELKSSALDKLQINKLTEAFFSTKLEK